MRVIPPLSQSLVEKGSCPEGYCFEVIEGNKQPDSMQSERGSEIHHVLSEYVSWCVSRSVAVDFDYFDKLSAAAGPIAGPILDNMRDTFVVDWKHVLATEVRLRLDSNLEPTKHEQDVTGITQFVEMAQCYYYDDNKEARIIDVFPGLAYSGKAAAHAGTLDVILINEDATEAVCPDYKSHPRPFEPDTYQSMLYPFMLMKHIPTVQKVTFRLVFIRYGADVTREVVWTREDMPEMAIQIRRARERQLALEAKGEGPALPGLHCQYCPKITKPTLCSISEFNPQINTPLEERLRFTVWAAEQAKVSKAVMKDYVNAARKPITILDANGKAIQYGIHDCENTICPLDETSFKILQDHMKVSAKDSFESMNLRISSTSLKSKLDTKMRAGLRKSFEDSVIMRESRPKFGIRKPDGDVDTGYSQDDEF